MQRDLNKEELVIIEELDKECILMIRTEM
jgi:hypothetical protein